MQAIDKEQDGRVAEWIQSSLTAVDALVYYNRSGAPVIDSNSLRPPALNSSSNVHDLVDVDNDDDELTRYMLLT